MINQADEIGGLRTEQAACDVEARDASAGGAKRVEVVDFAGIAAQEHGRGTVHGGEVVGDVCERQGSEAVVPVVEDLLAGAEGKGTAGLFDTEEAGDEVQDGWAGVTGEIGK